MAHPTSTRHVDDIGIARRAADDLDHISPMSASPAFDKIALRGILHALLALADARDLGADLKTTRKPAPRSTEAQR